MDNRYVLALVLGDCGETETEDLPVEPVHLCSPLLTVFISICKELSVLGEARWRWKLRYTGGRC